MRLIRDPRRSTNSAERQTFNLTPRPKILQVGETYEEAIENNLDFYLYGPCRRKHHLFDEEGNKINLSVSAVSAKGGCLLCRQIHRRKLANTKRDLKRPNLKRTLTARRSKEDIELAKELGITVEELLS